MTGAKKSVVGASGFRGSHVTRQLVDRGDDVRVMVRRTSSTKATTRSAGPRSSIGTTHAVAVDNAREKQVVDYACLLLTPD
jgi:uncharacterized protein YbjT (DUF2867 family)